MAAAPDRPELTGVSPQFRDQLPPLAKALGRARLLRWQAQLRGAEQQLRQSVQPRLWLEVLLLGLLAEPTSSASTAPAASAQRPAVAAAAPAPPPAAPSPAPAAVASPAAAQAEPPSSSSPAAAPPAEALAPAQTAKEPAATSPKLPNLPGNEVNLPELWQQILGSLELPSTWMLLSQQDQLVRIDANRAVVQVAGNWMGMVQSRASLLEQAVAKALGGSRQLVLEAGSGMVAPAPVVAPPTPKPVTPPVIQPIAPPAPPAAAPIPTTPETSAEVDPISPPAPAPIAAPVASPKPAVEQEAPQREQPIARPTEERAKPEPQTPPTAAADIDRHAKTLVNFFNGEVLAVDDIESTPVNEATNKTPNTPQ